MKPANINQAYRNEFRYTRLNMGLTFSINHLSPSQSTPEYAIGSEWRTYKHNP